MSNLIGNWNTGVGSQSLLNVNGSSANTAIGYLAGSQITTGNNNIAIGYNAQVPSATSDNQVRIGNSGITYAGIQVPWTITSDLRLKTNICNTNLGLNFVSKLRPVSYIRTNDEQQRTEYGFVAQEVEEILKEAGVENSGMISVDDEGTYSLRYNDLLAPMVKAIQELKVENEKLKKEKDAEISNLKSQLDEIMLIVSELQNKQDEVENLKVSDNR